MSTEAKHDPGLITHDEAEQIALAYIDKAFNNPEKPGRRIRHSIPANPREDTDLRLMAYIRQQRAADIDDGPYNEVFFALQEAAGALSAIDSQRHDPVGGAQCAAVAELRRVIDQCEQALQNGPRRPVDARTTPCWDCASSAPAMCGGAYCNREAEIDRDLAGESE